MGYKMRHLCKISLGSQPTRPCAEYLKLIHRKLQLKINGLSNQNQLQYGKTLKLQIRSLWYSCQYGLGPKNNIFSILVTIAGFHDDFSFFQC